MSKDKEGVLIDGDVLESVRSLYAVNSKQQGVEIVLGLAGMELTFFIAVRMERLTGKSLQNRQSNKSVHITCYPRVYEKVLLKMHGISHVASTPVAGSTVFNGERRHSLSQHISPSYACAFLDDDHAYECCSTSPLTGSLSTCRRSPRLLSNGYYVLTEDSFLSDEEGNITLTPSRTNVTYKENLVRVFRRRRKIRRSLHSLFNLSASSSWLSSTVLTNVDSSHVDDPWPDGCDKLEITQSDNGDSDFSSEYNSYVPQKQTPASNGASLIKDEGFIQPWESFCACASQSCSPFMMNANQKTLSDAESSTVRNVLSQMVALITCLIISICTRYFLGGLSATLLLIILVFLLSQDAAVSPFFSLDTSFKTTEF
ncbi:PREDICTED: transmembrane protein 71, partial [Mesitornis unicolor]|uniref:transmembrane protein 71 n=1 Tax=Mesitornis unicolor TaxID=54374 RepID=UPI0005293BD2